MEPGSPTGEGAAAQCVQNVVGASGFLGLMVLLSGALQDGPFGMDVDLERLRLVAMLSVPLQFFLTLQSRTPSDLDSSARSARERNAAGGAFSAWSDRLVFRLLQLFCGSIGLMATYAWMLERSGAERVRWVGACAILFLGELLVVTVVDGLVRRSAQQARS